MSAYQDWALARSCKPCQRDHVTECRGLAWDVDEMRFISCLCGCEKDGRGDE